MSCTLTVGVQACGKGHFLTWERLRISIEYYTACVEWYLSVKSSISSLVEAQALLGSGMSILLQGIHASLQVAP